MGAAFLNIHCKNNKGCKLGDSVLKWQKNILNNGRGVR
jgi:hypothetical protein